MTPAPQPLWICTNCGKKNNTNPLRCPACGWDEFKILMTPAPQSHCDHDKVCSDVIAYLKSVLPEGKCAVMRCKDVILDFSCPHDTRSRPAPSHDVDCNTCKFGEQCRPLAYIPPCYNHGPDSPARAAAQARIQTLDAVNTKLNHLMSQYPTGAWFVWWSVIESALKELRTEAHK